MLQALVIRTEAARRHDARLEWGFFIAMGLRIRGKDRSATTGRRLAQITLKSNRSRKSGVLERRLGGLLYLPQSLLQQFLFPQVLRHVYGALNLLTRLREVADFH